jgi:hypothetical protein
MLIVFPLRSSKVVGTDIFHAAALLWVAGFGHYVAGNVDLHAVAWLLVGSIPGVLLSSGLTVKLPDRILRVALAITLLASGVKLIDVPHGNVIALGVLSAGLLALAGVGFSRLLAAHARSGAAVVVTPVDRLGADSAVANSADERT